MPSGLRTESISTMDMATHTPTMYKALSDPDSLQLRSSSNSTYPEEKLIFPNPAISVISAVAGHAKRSCKQLHLFHGRRHHHEKPPNMAKMRIVTPVYDHDLGRWVWPDNVCVDEDEGQFGEQRRRESRSVDAATSRSSSQSPLSASSSASSSRRSSRR